MSKFAMSVCTHNPPTAPNLNPQILCEKVIDIRQKMSVNKSYCSYLHVKSGVFCP